MKNLKLIITIMLSAVTLVLLITSITLASININKFDKEKEVFIYTRDTASGTRNEFFIEIDFKEAKTNDLLLKNPVITSSNGEMLDSIKNDKYGIGYASFSSIKNISGIKQIKIDNIECSLENIKNDSYKLTRNFKYLTRNTTDLKQKAAITIFKTYIDSLDGTNVIESEGAVVDRTGKKHFKEYNLEQEEKMIKDSKITLNIGGSTSVANISRKIIRSFKSETNYNISFKEEYTGSTDAILYTKDSASLTNRLDFGFLSRDLEKEEETKDFNIYDLCKDGIAVIVNSKNDISNITLKNLKDIYQKKRKWSDL